MSETKLILNIFPYAWVIPGFEGQSITRRKKYVNEHLLSPFLLDTNLQKWEAIVFPHHEEKNNALFWIL